MGLFFPIFGGMFVLGIIIIGVFAFVTTIVGFFVGGTAYALQREKNIETLARTWLLVTALLTIGGLIWFVLWL